MQEEYIEWRVVRDERGIRRVELTTELSDYWRILAAYEPRHTLELVANFAGQPSVPVEAVYRGCDPFASSTTNDQREAAFAAAMLAETDRDSISGRVRCATCAEFIPLISPAAQLGRASDPVLVERLARLAYEGRLVAFDDPLGIYIQSVEHARLRTSRGDPVPPEWFVFGRGLGPAQTSDGRARWQRVTIAPPSGSSLRVSDLVDVATEQPIRHGGQIAELIQIAVVLRVSGPDTKPPGTHEPAELAQEVSGCADVRRHLGGSSETTSETP